MPHQLLSPLVQLSSRGQLTLPAEVRKALGLQPGDAFRVLVTEGGIVLEPVEITPVELYSEARIEAFRQTAEMSEDVAQARAVWGL